MLVFNQPVLSTPASSALKVPWPSNSTTSRAETLLELWSGPKKVPGKALEVEKGQQSVSPVMYIHFVQGQTLISAY